MSHIATAWAFSMRHLKPATKIVLLTLADCHNPAYGCFPGQEFIAEACEMSERSVRDHLTKLEGLGLITRHHRGKIGTRYQSDEYELHFRRSLETDKEGNVVLVDTQKPAANFAGSQEKPAANYDKSQRQNLPPNPVREIGNNARATHAHAREATPRPIPHCHKCIPSGSTFEVAWDEWTRPRCGLRLSELSTSVGDGWDAPWSIPPSAEDTVQTAMAEKWLQWCLNHSQAKAA